MTFFKDGNFTFGFRTFLCFLGVGIIAVAFYFVENKFWFYVISTLGLFVGYLGGYASQAAVLKLKPFTNDPLGWRSAKASYESKDDEQKEIERRS
jgi:sulfite exporter TauE/SafE